MTSEVNPFQPPGTNEIDNSSRVDSSSFVHWPIVYAMNAIVPMIVGWGLSEQAGRQGIIAACALILLFGWKLCYQDAESARRLIRGSLVLSFTQLFPVLQIAIGFVGKKIASWVAGNVLLPPDNSRAPLFQGALTSELEGVIATFLVGMTLIACASALGFLIAIFESKAGDPEEQTS